MTIFRYICFMDIKKIQKFLNGLVTKCNPEEIAQEAISLIFQQANIAQINISLKLPFSRCTDCDKPKNCVNGTSCLHKVSTQTKLHKPFINNMINKMIYKCAASDRLQFIADLQDDYLKSFAVFPLTYLKESLGTMDLLSFISLSQAELTKFNDIANIIASAVYNSRELAKNYINTLNIKDNNTVVACQKNNEIIGISASINAVLKQINLVAPTDAAVLISGESGTGKELIANAIHRNSKRANMQLVKTNCASIPRELYESEFFGHAQGAFTGAIKDKNGRFQLAHQGTLFLDEIGEIPLELQSKLLRVLQEGEYEKLGETKTRKINVRIVCATNRNLFDMVKKGTFRKDLYYRLNVFPIELPALKNRIEDIPILAETFIQKLCLKYDIKHINLNPQNIYQLQSYSWPGNVRELQNIIERALIESQNGTLKFYLPHNNITNINHCQIKIDDKNKILNENEMRDFEIQNTIRALKICNHKIYGIDGAANLLGIKPTTLNSRIKKWKINN